MEKLFLLVASYLLGSLPFGMIIAFLVKRQDIRQHGSGNIGATNVFRVVGKLWGIVVFILDFLKGMAVPLIAHLVIPESESYIYVICALLAVCGHNWPIFLKFKGGKGVSTSVGAIAGLALLYPRLWLVLATAAISWGLIFAISKVVSLASLLAALIFFIFCFLSPLPGSIKFLSVTLFLFIVIRHRENIKRLLSHQEHAFK